MEWLLTNTQIHSTFSSLGSVQGDNYVASADCLEILEDINYKLEIEDQSLRSFRRAIGFGQNVRHDIIPLLVNVKDRQILDGTIRLLVNLTIPVECLMPVDTVKGRHMVFELNKLLSTIKELFTDGKTTKSILEYMKVLLLDNDTKNSKVEINNCLLLLRNILNIPEHLHNSYFTIPRTSMQNQILWNLFTQSVDRVLLQVMTCPESSLWCVSLVQLIALMYKDQHVHTLQKLLNICFEASISDSSDDNESNTETNSDASPPSDPTSDSSDNGELGAGQRRLGDDQRNLESTRPTKSAAVSSKEVAQDFELIEENENPEGSNVSSASLSNPAPSTPRAKRKLENDSSTDSEVNTPRSKLPTTSDQSDCGYATQLENNPESQEYKKPPVHQKPPATNQKQRMNLVNRPRKVLTTSERTEWRRKKLMKRSLSSWINMKGMVNHTPTDDDITNVLKEFSVDFLLKGYGALISDLHAQLMSDVELVIDTSHFFWLVTYFLKFAGQLELGLGHVHSIFTFDIIGYSIYEAASICEQLDTAGFEMVSSSLRRLHLSVTAIREFLQAIETYKQIGHLIRPEDVHFLGQLEYQIASSSDLKNLFILLLRRFNPAIQSKQYLQDVIVTNHALIMIMDKVSQRPEWSGKVAVDEHIKQFASVEIMHWFGYLLEDFNENGLVNDCIFTMMHHVSGDCGHVSILCQPIILKTFLKIWDTEFEMCDDWSDLVSYVINKFISKPVGNGEAEPSGTPDYPQEALEWTGVNKDSLNWYFAQAKSKDNPIEDTLRHFDENGHAMPVKELADQLIMQGLITPEVANKYCPQTHEAELVSDNSEKQDSHTDDVQFLCQKLTQESPQHIIWLQRVLLECSFVKRQLEKGVRSNREMINEISAGQPLIMEPVALNNILKKQSVPLIPWSNKQLMVSMYQPFVLLLHKLGFHLPADARKNFARIPEFWTHEHLLSIAKRLGPIPIQPKHRVFQRKGSSDSELNVSTLNSDGYPGNATTATTGRKSAYSRVSITNWLDSPTVLMSAGKPKESAWSTISDSSAEHPLRRKSSSIHRNWSSRKESIEDDASSAAAVVDEQEVNRDVFDDLDVKAKITGIGQSACAGYSFTTAGEAVDSISVWETASQICGSGMLCVSDEEEV